jgi:hypothetical protein
LPTAAVRHVDVAGPIDPFPVSAFSFQRFSVSIPSLNQSGGLVSVARVLRPPARTTAKTATRPTVFDIIVDGYIRIGENRRICEANYIWMRG